MTKSIGSPSDQGAPDAACPLKGCRGGGGGLGQDVLHVVLRIDQADRAVRLAVTVLSGVGRALAVSDLHPAVTLLVQDRLVDAATAFVTQCLFGLRRRQRPS